MPSWRVIKCSDIPKLCKRWPMGLFGHAASIDGGFAVVDVETTGLYPSTDRVVEIAVVQLNADAEITAEFCTLINPRRDVGPTRLHGITAADVTSAPTFAAAAATLWQLLNGRILVAHNAPFDARFLNAEFTRCGTRLPPPPLMCTMQLASHYLRGLPARTLTACCDIAGIDLAQHHSALHDARAAAQLLACFRAAHPQLPDSWVQALTQAARTAWIPSPPHAQFRAIDREDQMQRRASQRPPLADLVDRLPRGPGGDLDSYLAILDRILEDRIVSDAELTQLAGLAAELGFTQDTARRAHRDYLAHLSAAAWRDKQVTDAERADLLDVARLLDVPASEALTILEDTRNALPPAAQQPGALHPGDPVVFTGDMTISRTEIEARATAAGLRVTASISTKTALVIAADPYTQSGKANRARQLGIRMVTEQVFLHMIDHIQDTRHTSISESPAGSP
jgi:DNA polymerase III subunit epsilon